MCGITCAFELKEDSSVLRPQLLEMSKKLRHRGPDWSGIYSDNNAILAHERLSIVDPVSGKQPLYGQNDDVVLAVNGEIYNHLNLKEEFEGSYVFKTESDCEVILALYEKYGFDFINKLNGIFAFALYDIKNKEYLIARDHIGVVPLYMGWDKKGTFYIASELKALEGFCNKIEIFPPGKYFSSKKGNLERWYERSWSLHTSTDNENKIADKLRTSLEKAVYQQLMTDVPYGVLLSGGLDSSIIAAITKKYSNKRIETNDSSEAWWPQLHSFSVGLQGSPDLKAAKKVSQHIDSIHHEVIFTIQEGLDSIEDVI